MHGIHQINIPWAQTHSRFTLMFQQLAIDILKQCTITGAAKILRISWDQAWHIMELAVKRGLNRKTKEPISYLGVDEKSVLKGNAKDNVFIILSIVNGAQHVFYVSYFDTCGTCYIYLASRKIYFLIFVALQVGMGGPY